MTHVPYPVQKILQTPQSCWLDSRREASASGTSATRRGSSGKPSVSVPPPWRLASFWCRSGSGFGSGSYPKVLLMFENQIFFTYITSSASLQCFIFLVSVMIFNIFDSLLTFSGKRVTLLYVWLKWIWIRIRISRSWMLRIRIRQNNADPTGSGSSYTTFVIDDILNSFCHKSNLRKECAAIVSPFEVSYLSHVAQGHLRRFCFCI